MNRETLGFGWTQPARGRRKNRVDAPTTCPIVGCDVVSPNGQAGSEHITGAHRWTPDGWI